MKSWLISIRTDKFNLERAFAELEDNCIDQYANHAQFKRGDIVYIYCVPDSVIKYKCIIKKTNVPNDELIDDSKYMLNQNFFTGTHKNIIRLQFLEEVNIPLTALQSHGLKGGLGLLQHEIKDGLLQYLNSVTCNADTGNTTGEFKTIDKTEAMQLSVARIGQGVFRQRVIAQDKKCMVTGVEDVTVLNASHIKAWSESTNHERLDGNNGILLSPHLDKLFDKHLISFSDDGKIMVFGGNTQKILDSWNIDVNKEYVRFSEERKKYLAYHREICRGKTC